MSKPLSSGAWVAVLCGSLTALGCKVNADDPIHEPCTGAVTISVDLAEQRPRFRWSPKCHVASVVVTSAPGTGLPSEYWRIESDKSILAPPITYGQLPTSNATSSAVVPLTSNQDYRVTVYVLDRLDAVGVGSWRQP